MTSIQKGSFSRLVIVILVVILVILAGSIWWFKAQYDQLQNQFTALEQSPAIQQERAVSDVTAQLAAHVVLPSNETPSVATVQDADTLKQDSTFYADAKNGDYVVIYQTKAYLYNPTLDRVVNIGPVILPTATDNAQPDETAQPTNTNQ
ncbi:MAG: hypothetical protein HYV33_00200 [Candidatus Kerfeldbacteria bacterium]|nr:hypothetical protein [Candidatus Kerfeldbacteria bacterium]